jgi:1-acyl-sn-glycerol-3-phosphate acyltransferase
LLYWLIKPFAIVFFRIFYKYDYIGRDKIPHKKPLVFAPNHVNAFIDPMAIGLITDQKVRFFARGDVFKKPLAAFILNDLSVSPVFRIQEGFSEIRKNDKTFEECKRRLQNNETILMFPEGICVQERKLRPLKKGVSRIVFQTEEAFDFKKEVLVMPVGLNYTKAYQFRSKLYIHFGEPVSLLEFRDRYKEDKVRTINDFTKHLEKKLAELMVIVNNPENEKLLEHLEEIYMDQWLKDKGKDNTNLENSYYGSREVSSMINHLDETQPEFISSLRNKAEQYIRKVRVNGLRDHLLRPENIENISIGSFIKDYLIIWLGMPFYCICWFLNYPPYFFAKTFATKNIKTIEFHASVYANLAMIFWGVYAFIQMLIIALVFRDWLLLSIYTVLFLPATGFFALWFYPVKEKIFGRWRLLRMVKKKRELVEQLVNERFLIMRDLDHAKNEYINFLKS